MTWTMVVDVPHLDEWFPCESPEKPFDEGTAFHACCSGCHHAIAAGRARGEVNVTIEICDPPNFCLGYDDALWKWNRKCQVKR